MLLEDILALACVISFGGWVVSRYYIWKYSRADEKNFLNEPRRNLDSLRLQAKITGIISIITFVLFNLVYERS